MSPVEELNGDLSFNESNLHEKIAGVPGIVTKWADRFIKAKRRLATLETERSRLIKGRTNYYAGRKKNPDTDKFCPATLSPQEIRDTYIPGDDVVIEVTLRVATQKSQVLFFEHAVKQANAFQWTIKNYIEWQKYTQGAM